MGFTAARERIGTVVTPGEIERVSPHDLWGWLSTFDHDAVVCPDLRQDRCIFATYWSARFGDRRFLVGMVGVTWDDGYAEMPAWAERFQLAAFDDHGTVDAPLTVEDPFTAGNLLALLGPFLTEAQVARAGCD